MANTDAPFGFRPKSHSTGGVIRSKAYRNGVASAYNTSIFRGDVVERVADGSFAQAAAANADNWGVFAGCQYTDSNGKPKWSQYWPADTVATDIIAYVYDDPDILFEVQTDATGATNADEAALADWEVVAGSTATGQSKFNLDISAGLATTNKALRIIALSKDPGNESGAYTKVLVQFAEHVKTNVVAGVGGVTT